MNLGTHDLHVVLDRTERRCKVFAAGGQSVFDCECRNRTVNDSASPSVRWAPCPSGEFILGQPVPENSPPFGPFFVLIEDTAEQTMARNGRAGIGCHGGGSGLPNWNAPWQGGWVPTHGCWRFGNESLEELVRLIHAARAAGGICYCTVAPWTPGSGMPGANGMPDIDVDETQLDPRE